LLMKDKDRRPFTHRDAEVKDKHPGDTRNHFTVLLRSQNI